MTPNSETATNNQTSSPDKTRSMRGRKLPKSKASTRRAPKRTGRARSAAGGNSYIEAASRYLSQGRRAATSVSGWAADGARKALPLAKRHIPDQRQLQDIIENRPLVLGAIGLGIGAIVGLMLSQGPMPGHAFSRPMPTTRKSRKR